MRIRLNLMPRGDTGKINYSPIPYFQPVYVLRNGLIHNIIIDSQDQEDDFIKCRWSQWLLNECAGKLIELNNKKHLMSLCIFQMFLQ